MSAYGVSVSPVVLSGLFLKVSFARPPCASAGGADASHPAAPATTGTAAARMNSRRRT